MTTKVGISLPDSTYARAVELAEARGISFSGLVDEALRSELSRRELAAHVQMLAEAEDHDRLRSRARSRTEALSDWKTAG